MGPRKLLVPLLLIVLLAYSNHFQGAFHFDDSHAIVANEYVRSLRYIPRHFADATISSTLPDHATYRPVTAATFCVDYWLAGGYTPFWFHVSTFLAYCLLLLLMFWLFEALTSGWIALLAVAIYGLHPANAETINYIVQRAEVHSTLGMVAGLACFVRLPRWRRYGLYLLPVAYGCLAKAPALIFPVILLVYLLLFERSRWTQVVPAASFALALAALIRHMTPASFVPGAADPVAYRLSQPWIALHYFRSFFLPIGLSADSDWGYASRAEMWIGALFVLCVMGFAIWSKIPAVSFGLYWFILTLLPTALTPLAEVENDHRMFLPFVGLSLAVAKIAHLFTQNRRIVRLEC